MNSNQAVILCGGRGKRLMPFTKNNPKPLYPISGIPFLELLIKLLIKRGIKNFLLLTGYKSLLIKNHFNSINYSNVNIIFHEGSPLWETNKRIFKAKELINNKFYLLYSDNFINFFPNKLVKFHIKQKKPITLTIFKKKNGNIYHDKNLGEYFYNLDRNKLNNYVDLGFMYIQKNYLFNMLSNSNTNFSTTLHKASMNKKISYLQHFDQYYSISDLKRANLAEKYLSSKKILLLDRDGIINVKAPKGEYITSWKKFFFIKKNLNTLIKLSNEGYNFIILTNQAGVSRNKMSLNKLNLIHKKMITYLSKLNINILKIISCNHGWNENCACRKPKPGMFFQASKKYLFRLDEVLYIGDDIRDVEASNNAGCNSILIKSNFHPKNTIDRIKKNKTFKSMSDAYSYIIKFYSSNDNYKNTI